MKDLIEALQIFMKYCGDVEFPSLCEEDEFIINCVSPDDVSKKDIKRLDELSFRVYDGEFISYRFGSN